MELKPYQAKVINDLHTYLTLVDQQQDYVKAYTQFWNDQWIAVGTSDPKSMPAYKDIVAWCPHVTVKVPTAWGKTFIATNAIKTIFDHLDPLKEKVVVWLVPSITILDQTIQNLSNTDHPYRQKLDLLFQNRVQIYTKEQVLQWASFSLDAIQEQLSIIVMSYDTFRSKSKDNRKIYEDNSNLNSFESVVTTSIVGEKDTISAMNVLHNLRPVIIVDEAHNTTGELSVEMLQNLNPCCIVDLTATPRENANIISIVGALELKKEEMVKLPVVAYNQQNLDEVITNAVHFQHQLEQLAKENQDQWGEYIRPIVLFQAQPKWWDDDEWSFQKIKEKLIRKWIPEEQVKIKTATINEIKNINLMSHDCPVRFIITINALKEWWDCPFAYILASLANKSSEIDVTQILGRILRQPFAHRTQIELLNCSYVFTASDKFHDVLQKIVLSLNAWGYSSKKFYKQESSPDNLVIWINESKSVESLFWDGWRNTEDDLLEMISDTPIAPIQENNNIAQTIANQANSQIEAFNEATADIDMSWFMASELEERKNHFPVKEQFFSALDHKIPQFMMGVEGSWFFAETNGMKLVETEDCLHWFQLHTQPTDIIFDSVDNTVFVVDVQQTGSNQFAPESSKLSTKATQKFMSYIAQQSDEVAVKSVANIVLWSFRRLDHINEKDLKKYVMRVLEWLTTDQIADLKQNPFKYSSKIEEKIKKLQNEHKAKKFVELLDIGTITIRESFQLPKQISPLETTQWITKSLYTEEGSMNPFEHKIILAIANLDSVARRHRNIERKWLVINGRINHYPDFIVHMKSWKTILVETKWDDRDNSDSEDKVRLWSYWANKAWENYRYMMVFEKNKINGAFNLDEALERLKVL
jgi:type III restriction enzyme